MINVLKTLKNELKTLNVPYAYDKWEDDVILPFFIGELDEVESPYEDGKSEYSFTLTGEDVNSYLKLYEYAEILKKEYKQSKKIKCDGGYIVISYDNTTTIPVDLPSVKRIQIKFTIYLWEEE